MNNGITISAIHHRKKYAADARTAREAR